MAKTPFQFLTQDVTFEIKHQAIHSGFLHHNIRWNRALIGKEQD